MSFKTNKKQITSCQNVLNGLVDKSHSKGLSGVSENQVSDVELLKSNYSDSVFIRYSQLQVVGEYVGKSVNYIEITPSGTSIEHAESKLKFESLSDRVHFFNSLYPIEL